MTPFLKKMYFRYLWWIWQVVLVLLALFFLVLGIQILLYAYRLEDPFNFILAFFSSNLIILISLVLLAGFIYRIIGVYRLVGKKGRRSGYNSKKK